MLDYSKKIQITNVSYYKNYERWKKIISLVYKFGRDYIFLHFLDCMDIETNHIETIVNKKRNELESSPAIHKNRLYPIFLKLDQLETLVVGGGNVALEKLQSLLSNSPEAKITVIASQVKDEIIELISEHPSSKIIMRAYEEHDLENKDLVILATENRELHEYIKESARQKGIIVNVADTPDLCDFYLGSIVQKGRD